MDWSSFWGSGNMPAVGNDPYEPTAEQRRRILEESLRGLGQGMVKAAFSPTWGGFGMAFNEGLANMSDIQKGGYDRMMEQNQKNALFRSNMEQEALATQSTKLDIKHKEHQAKEEEDDDKIKEALRSEAPNIINTLYNSTKSLLDGAQVPESLKPKLDLYRKQLEINKALALRDPEHKLEAFNAFAFSAADLVGQKQALQEKLDQEAHVHAVNSGWVHQGPDGSVTADIPGMLAWSEKKRGQELRQGEASIAATNALVGQRDRANTGDDKDPTKGQVSWTIPQINKEMEKIQTDAIGLLRGKSDDSHLDLSDPRAYAAAQAFGFDVTKADKDGLLAVTPDEMARLNTMLDPVIQEEEAKNRLTRLANEINSLKGKPQLGEGTGLVPIPSGPKEGPKSVNDLTKIPTVKKGEEGQPENLAGKNYPTPAAVAKKIAQDGPAKVISELKKLGLTREQIKQKYGI